MVLRREVLLAATVAVGAALAATTSRSVVPRSGREGPAPDLVFDYVDGAVGRLSSLRGNPVLLSFLDTREHTTDGVDNPDMSRRLLVFIESMRNQYSARGLTVAIVDASPPVGVEPPGRLLNFRFDHGLTDTPITSGASARQAMRDFAVRSLPTTFLIDRQGQIKSRWEGLVLASTLAKAIGKE
jgi:hypothetical protein